MVAAKNSEGKYYRIAVRGHLDTKWSEWFNSMTIKYLPNGETVLSGYIIDQSALHGLLNKIRDLGIPLVSVRPLDNENGAEEFK